MKRIKNEEWVYVIALKDRTCVKIGFTGSRPEDRLKVLLVAHPSNDALVLLAALPGSRRDEQLLHKRFVASRIPGKREWFSWTKEISDWIEILLTSKQLSVAQWQVCPICERTGHTSRWHDAPSAASLEAGRLVYEDDFSFAEAGRRVGISSYAAQKGWRFFILRKDTRARDLQKSA